MSTGRIQFAEMDGTFVLKFIGEIRLTLCSALDATIEKIFSSLNFSSIVIDLTESRSIDSTTLGLLAKLGADGVMVMAAPDGTAVAVKALDGSTRAGDLVALALLARFAPDHVDADRLPAVLETVAPKILGKGEPVGAVRLARPVLDLLD